jgi:hypothetical protein
MHCVRYFLLQYLNVQDAAEKRVTIKTTIIDSNTVFTKLITF